MTLRWFRTWINTLLSCCETHFMAFAPVVEGSFCYDVATFFRGLDCTLHCHAGGCFCQDCVRSSRVAVRKTLPLLFSLTSMPSTGHCSISALYHTINLLQNPARLGSVHFAGFRSQMFQTCDATGFLCETEGVPMLTCWSSTAARWLGHAPDPWPTWV